MERSHKLSIKRQVFAKFIHLGMDTVNRYAKFIIDAPAEEQELRHQIILSLDRIYSDDELERFISFFY